MKIEKESYSPYLLDELVMSYAGTDKMAPEIWDEVYNEYGDESLADDVVEALTREYDDDEYEYDDGNEEGYH